MDIKDYAKVLKDCEPIDALAEEYFDQLLNKSELVEAVTGDYFFQKGDSERKYYFLLNGDIELVTNDDTVLELISSGTERARHPIAHSIPRKVNARASSIVVLACAIPCDMLEIMLTWDRPDDYNHNSEEVDSDDMDEQDDLKELSLTSSDNGDWMTTLLRSDLFKQMPASNIQAVMMKMQEICTQPEEVIFKQNDAGEYFYIIKEGECAVIRTLTSKDKVVRLASLGPGDAFGEESLISGKKRNASVVMLTKGRLMRLSKEDFLSFMNQPLLKYADIKEALQMQLKEHAIWIDARLPNEYMQGHIKDSINIPLVSLRMKLAQMDSHKKYVIYCNDGTKSSAAAFLMASRGFNPFVLEKGLQTVPESVLERSN